MCKNTELFCSGTPIARCYYEKVNQTELVLVLAVLNGFEQRTNEE